jgi:hypothetical protein
VDVFYSGGPNAEFWNWLSCRVNAFRSYACDTHAHSYQPSGKPNAVYNPRTGTVRLVGDALPTVRPKPQWIRRWHWDNGFIVPFDHNGHLLPGITVKHDYRRTLWVCRPTLRGSLVGYCGAGGVAIFARWPARTGDLVAFTWVTLAGTTAYDMFRAP